MRISRTLVLAIGAGLSFGLLQGSPAQLLDNYNRFADSLNFAPSAAAAEEVWQLVKPEGLGFSVEMPGRPNVKEEDVDLGDGKGAKKRTFRVISKMEEVYQVEVVDCPKGFIQAVGGEEQVLDAQGAAAKASAIMQAMGIKIKSETKIEFVGRPTRETFVDMTRGMTLRSRDFIVGDRIFAVQVVTEDGNVRSASAEKYFASFRLTEAPPNAQETPAAAAWRLVKPDGLGFSVEMPKHPAAEEQWVGLGGGKWAKRRTFQIISEMVLYRVMVTDYPKGASFQDNYRNMKMPGMESLKSETKIEFGGRPARELLLDMTMGKTIRSRIFVLGERVFNVMVTTDDGNERSASVEKYFSSFKLTDSEKR